MVTQENEEKFGLLHVAIIAIYLLVLFLLEWKGLAIGHFISGSEAPEQCHEWSEPDLRGIQHYTLNCGTSREVKKHPSLFLPKYEIFFWNNGVKSVIDFPCRREIQAEFGVTLPPVR